MHTRTLKCVAVLACCVLTLAGVTASGGDKGAKGKPAPSGVWVMQGGEMKLDFTAKDVMKVYPHGENEVIVLVCKVSVGKEGQVRAKLTEFEGKDKAKKMAEKSIPLGLEFSFRWRVKDGTATLDEVAGKDVPDLLKSHLEGKYEMKK